MSVESIDDCHTKQNYFCGDFHLYSIKTRPYNQAGNFICFVIYFFCATVKPPQHREILMTSRGCDSE